MDRQKLIETLEKVDEGYRSKVYPDKYGIPTIGIGRNVRDRGITKGEAYHLLNNDLDEVEADLDSVLSWWRRLDEVRQNVFANMCFQMGITGLMQFENMLAHAILGEFDQAAAAMLDSKWAREDSPKRALRLAEEMRHGGGKHVASVA